MLLALTLRKNEVLASTRPNIHYQMLRNIVEQGVALKKIKDHQGKDHLSHVLKQTIDKIHVDVNTAISGDCREVSRIITVKEKLKSHIRYKKCKEENQIWMLKKNLSNI